MLAQPLVLDGRLERQLFPGDVLAGAEVLPVTNANTAITVTAAMIATGLIQRSPAAPGTDTFDTAANLVAGFSGGIGNTGIAPGVSFRVRWLNSTANAITLAATANTGVTVTNTAVPASGWKDVLVQFLNGTPAQTFSGNTTNASPVITGLTLAQTALLSPGMVVINAVNGLQGTTILSVQPGVGVTLSGNANATSVAPGVAISFSPVVNVIGIGSGVAL